MGTEGLADEGGLGFGRKGVTPTPESGPEGGQVCEWVGEGARAERGRSGLGPAGFAPLHGSKEFWGGRDEESEAGLFLQGRVPWRLDPGTGLPLASDSPRG